MLAEWESAQLAERIVDGIQKNAERCMANGQQLYGWDIVEGYYEINEAEAGVLRRAKGMLFNDKTVAEIVRALEGHTTKRGKPITHNALTKMLKRKQNAGVFSYAGHEKEGGMPALWSMEEQRMIWKMLGDETRPRRKAGNADFLLTGKLWCGKCDTPMTGTSGTGKSGKVYSCASSRTSATIRRRAHHRGRTQGDNAGIRPHMEGHRAGHRAAGRQGARGRAQGARGTAA